MKIKTPYNNIINYKKYLKVTEAVTNYLNQSGYLRIELPVLSPSLIPESYLEVFKTEFKYLDKKENLYLTPSPELFLKRLLAYGVGDCYYLGKSFRNSDPLATLHSYEFTMLEFYKLGVDYMGIADEVLKMLQYVSNQVESQKSLTAQAGKFKSESQNLKITYQDKTISFEKWEKITVAEAFKKYADISEKELFDQQMFLTKAQKKGYRIDGFSYGDVWSQIYTIEIEPHLGNKGYATLIYDYPKEFAALAKLNKDGKTAQRFEFYIRGVELGDCYTELTDWKEQEKRFKEEDRLRNKSRKTAHPIDNEYIEALKYGLGHCSGIAIGMERLGMIFADVVSIDRLKLINIIN